MISEEEFQTWRENPITQLVFGACLKAADDAQELWLAKSWRAGVADEAALIELRARAATYRDITAFSHADLVATYEKDETNEQ